MYNLKILGTYYQIELFELIELLDTFTLDQVKEIYYDLPKNISKDLKPYFIKRMGEYLGL